MVQKHLEVEQLGILTDEQIRSRYSSIFLRTDFYPKDRAMVRARRILKKIGQTPTDTYIEALKKQYGRPPTGAIRQLVEAYYEACDFEVKQHLITLIHAGMGQQTAEMNEKIVGILADINREELANREKAISQLAEPATAASIRRDAIHAVMRGMGTFSTSESLSEAFELPESEP